jgi:adenylosuccinate synthase
MSDIKNSPFYTHPERFLTMGQRVRAITRVYDLPGNEDQGPIHAEEGEWGTVVDVQHGTWPTVTFDRTGTSTCVTDAEVVGVPLMKEAAA